MSGDTRCRSHRHSRLWVQQTPIGDSRKNRRRDDFDLIGRINNEEPSVDRGGRELLMHVPGCGFVREPVAQPAPDAGNAPFNGRH